MWFVRYKPWRTHETRLIHKPRRTPKLWRDASAIGTTDFVTWEFIPLYQPPRVPADNITLTGKRNKSDVVRGT
ncbi:MAG TPA: hypothetical protein VMU83_02485 [Hanamia sp.]|nr:hypothetical protein [Hanamia sp.]